jgi:hypothetical protein
VGPVLSISWIDGLTSRIGGFLLFLKKILSAFSLLSKAQLLYEEEKKNARAAYYNQGDSGKV